MCVFSLKTWPISLEWFGSKHLRLRRLPFSWPYPWPSLVICFCISFFVAAVGGALTELGPWYYALKQPAWKPPDWAFCLVWSTIFSLCAVSAWLAWHAARFYDNAKQLRRTVWVVFGLNAMLNVVWSYCYFYLHRPDWAMVEWIFLWISVGAVVVFLSRIYRLAGYINIPYLVWVSIAGALNWETIRLNGPFY